MVQAETVNPLYPFKADNKRIPCFRLHIECDSMEKETEEAILSWKNNMFDIFARTNCSQQSANETSSNENSFFAISIELWAAVEPNYWF